MKKKEFELLKQHEGKDAYLRAPKHGLHRYERIKIIFINLSTSLMHIEFEDKSLLEYYSNIIERKRIEELFVVPSWSIKGALVKIEGCMEADSPNIKGETFSIKTNKLLCNGTVSAWCENLPGGAFDVRYMIPQNLPVEDFFLFSSVSGLNA
ncbi:MAG: hypothetical protein P1P88_04960 [Bacteroidales bacterium]|nr:hypothetical protein [Bacteroidales bacterium]